MLLQDTLARSALQEIDTAVVRSPLPGGVAAVVRAIFNLPSWVQISAVVVGVLAALAVLGVVWLRRAAILAWLRTRSRGWKLGLAGMGALALLAGGAFGMVSWNYTMHNNDFCQACHVMTPAFARFQHSEHSKLKCHDCHRQSIVASMRQLYFWVAERPRSIPPHAKVPTTVCKECHAQRSADSVWKQIVNTAGHSVHLRNDTSALHHIECVTCHGAEVHHFVPVDKTCGQANCHENVRMQIGRMAAQTSLHCTGCHKFTSRVAANISPDSARVGLVPTQAECFGCHRMQEKLAGFDPLKDKHKAACGSCHDPHKQAKPAAAFATCATSDCHARADTLTPYHRGISRTTLANCGDCHKAHLWKVEPTACVDCHGDIGGRRPAGAGHTAAGDDAAAAAPALAADVDTRPHGPLAAEADGDVALEPLRAAPVAPNDTTRFSHARHKGLACAQCHSSKEAHGQLAIARAPVGCQNCHHAARQKLTCTNCHPASTLPKRDIVFQARMTVWPSPRTKTLGFDHDRHGKLECRSCHTAQPSLAVEKTCASCHADHHTPTADCKSCHQSALATHEREATHQGCAGSGCHQDATVVALPASRSLCLSCHQRQVNHEPGGDCAECHRVRLRAASAEGGSR